jgi:hypothetical protein
MDLFNNRPGTRNLSPQPDPIDPLEPRLLLAAPVFDSSTAQLTVTGTDQADTIVVARDRRRASKVVVIVNGAGNKYLSRTIKTIRVDAGAGNDQVAVNAKRGTVSQRLVLLGGAGDDTLGGSLGNDDIEGDAGNDRLLGAGGNDSLDGGPGNDILFGARGDDTLLGGDDNDTLSDGRGNNALDGGAGVDTVNGKKETPGGGTDTGVNTRPDLQIKLKAESNYVGNDVYNHTAANQSRSAPGAFYPTIYHLRIQNDSDQPDNFVLTGIPGDADHWRVRFYESQATGYDGATSVTKNFTDPDWGGWTTGTLAPGQSKDFRMEVLPLFDARANDVKTVRVIARSIKNPARVDVVSATTTYATSRQFEIRRLNFDSSGQYLLTVQNFGNIVDRVRITGPRTGDGFTVRYFNAHTGGEDITGDVTAGNGWQSPLLAPGDEVRLKVVLNSQDAKPHSIQINADSVGDGLRKDLSIITNHPSPVKGPDFFPIGVWAQPAKDFDKWKARGINTVVIYEGYAATIDEWTKAAADRRLWMIRRPRPNPADDVGQPYLLAWSQPDEPDIPSTNHPSDVIIANYKKWKAVAPNIPIFTNFSGGYVNHWQGNVGYSDYAKFLSGTDWVSSSIYPVTGWDRPHDLDAPGKAVDRLEKWSEGKPQFAVIESGDQELPWAPKEIPGPTPGQFRAEIWDSIIRGARGIIYFPQKFKPAFSYDDTPPEIVQEMLTQHARIKSLEKVILTPIDPPSLGVTLGKPLEATWRTFGGKKYFIVLNLSDRQLNTATLGLHGVGSAHSATVSGEKRTVGIKSGVITDDFAPLSTHVYVVD